MEKRIKILYTITIIVIIAFLGMQVYWLLARYEFSLREYEGDAYETVLAVVDDYTQLRQNRTDSTAKDMTRQSQYNVNINSDKKKKTILTSKIVLRNYYAHKILGIKEKRKLTEEETKRAAEMVMRDSSLGNTKSVTFDASNAPSEAAVWDASKKLDIEYNNPFNTSTLDSLLEEHDINSSSRCVTTDSMVWTPSVIAHASVFSPTSTFSVPYSELERKSVIVACHFSPSTIFRRMAGNLIVAALLSVFLIACLLWQFSTLLKLSRLDKMRNSFITTMIHELKRPISTLKMCVSGIENERMMADAETKREIVAETRGALDNLSAYFSKLRDITFNNTEQIPLNMSSVNLHRLFDTASRGVSTQGKNVNITNAIDPVIDTPADPAHLLNIMTNLIENAIKYSGDSVDINAYATANDSEVEIRISDNGNGICADDLKHVFDRFFRGKAAMSPLPGMGLGLSYVKLLAEAHGGSVSVESEEGMGTTFIIKLPR